MGKKEQSRDHQHMFCKTWINSWTIVFSQSKSTQTHDKSCPLGPEFSSWWQGRLQAVWKSCSHSRDLTAKFSHQGSRVQERSSSPSSATTFLMILVTSFHDNHHSLPSLWVCAICSGYVFHRVYWDFPASIWYHHYHHLLPLHDMRGSIIQRQAPKHPHPWQQKCTKDVIALW